MQFSISDDRVTVTEELHEYLDRCLHFALGRFGPAVYQVTVRVGDVNGPRGGVDKRCQIVVKLRAAGSKPIVIEDEDETLYGAISHACDRAGRTVSRAIQRRRSKRSYRREHYRIEDATHMVGSEV